MPMIVQGLNGPPGLQGPPGPGELISVKDFGAIGNNIADDTAAIQATIDSAYSQSLAGVYLPSGKYKISSPLFLDPPGNLRTSLSSPTIFNFSLAMVGDDGTGNQEGFGTQILPTASNFVALWVGTGQGMHVNGISIIGPSGTLRALMSASGCGIAIATGGGGASRTLIENCGVANYYQGITDNFNGNGALGDSNTLVKCFVKNCYRGVSFLAAQNFINGLYDCTVDSCTTAVFASTTLVPINIWGGNYSNSGASRKKFTISSVSTLTGFSDTIAGNSFTNYRFTAVVTSPDTLMQGAGYTACAINTTGFGVIPLRLESFNAGTSTATFSFWPYWRFSAFGISFNVTANSDLQTEVQAATTLYGCEWVTVFSGGQYFVKGIHLENPNSLTTLISASHGNLSTNFFNYDITHSDLAASTGDDGALWYCQQAFPFIINPSGFLQFTGNNFSQVTPTESVIIDVGANARSIFENNDLYSPNIRYCSGENNITGNFAMSAESKVRGHGEWDINPWPSQAWASLVSWSNAWLKGYFVNQSPMRGYRPDPKTKPRLTPAQLTAITGSPGALNSYPLLNGEAIYEVLDYNTGAATSIFARSAHQFYSYGQNLTTTNVSGLSWSYKGQSSVVRMNATSLSWMFPGLKIILNNGTDGDQSYMVTGVHFALGYIVVTRIDENNTVLVGAKTATFSGTVIKQEVYTIRQYP